MSEIIQASDPPGARQPPLGLSVSESPAQRVSESRSIQSQIRSLLTLTLDVTILVKSVAAHRERLGPLDGPTGVGIVFNVQGHRVDIIPYGDVAKKGIIEPIQDVTLDITGMAEAAQHRHNGDG